METAGTWKNRVFAAGKGVLLSWIVTGILLALLSLALWKLDLDEGKVTIGIQAVYMLSAFAGGMMTGKKSTEPEIFVGAFGGNSLLPDSPGSVLYKREPFCKPEHDCTVHMRWKRNCRRNAGIKKDRFFQKGMVY